MYDVRSRASQLRRAWCFAANHAFTQRRAHEISCFKVTFHVSCNFLGSIRTQIIYGYIQVREGVVRQNMRGVPAWT